MSIKDILPKGKSLKKSHSKQCTICTHKKSAQIEVDFLTGRQIGQICKDYDITRSPLYNHMGLKGFTEFRSKNPSLRVEYLAEELADKVVYRGSDVTAMNRDLMKKQGELGPDSTVNINQNIGNLIEKMKDVPESEVDRMLEELMNGTGTEAGAN